MGYAIHMEMGHTGETGIPERHIAEPALRLIHIIGIHRLRIVCNYGGEQLGGQVSPAEPRCSFSGVERAGRGHGLGIDRETGDRRGNPTLNRAQKWSPWVVCDREPIVLSSLRAFL